MGKVKGIGRIAKAKVLSASAAARARAAVAAPVFSLGHERWVTCGFASGLTVSRAGHEDAVGRALRDASSVLALDSVNYFLARYPRTAAKSVQSCARRHVVARGGGDSFPFPMHAGDITHVIADLLCLPPPSSSLAGAEGHGSGGGGGGGGVGGGVGGAGVEGRARAEGEPGDVCALRLAALPGWRLLDAPNAFQEAFVCGMLVMDASQTPGHRGQRGLRYQESLLEARRVLRACILHEPSSIDGFWIAASVEGGVSPDPADARPPSRSPRAVSAQPGGSPRSWPDDRDGRQEGQPGATGEVGVWGAGDGVSRGRRVSSRSQAYSDELVRELGMSELELREEDLVALGESPASSGSGNVSGGAGGGSADDRLAFGHRSASSDSAARQSGGRRDGGAGGGGGGGSGRGAISSDWLMAGETARAGMIDSVTAENNGRPGPLVVDDGVFQTRLLCPSKIFHGEHARDLASHLPGMVASSDWVCLYSDARHGASLNTLLARCEGWEPTLVVIEASVASTTVGGGVGGDGGGGGSCINGSGGSEEAVLAAAGEGAAPGGPVSGKVSEVKRRERAVFGGFASGSQWKKSMGRSFDGNGQCFLFSFNNGGGGGQSGGGGSDGRGGGGSDRGGSLSVYPWAGSDRCFMTSDDAVGLGMGGGGDAGNFGFFLEPDLRRGSSGWCETFRNQPLAAAVAAPSVTAASLVAGATRAAPGSSGVGGPGVGVDDSTSRAGGVFEVVSVEVWGFRVPKTPEGLSRIAL